MILQALKEYYDRKEDLPRFGFENKEIPYIIVLDKNGNVVNIESTYEGVGKDKRARPFLVPKSIKKASGIASNLLWENPEYALGIKIKSDAARLKEMHKAFRDKVNLLQVSDDGINALKLFLENDNKEALLKSKFEETFKDLLEDKKALITFRLNSEPDIIVKSKNVLNAVENIESSNSSQENNCLISGQKDHIEELHYAIKGVWNAQPSGGNIVSFNLPAFCSYGKEQGLNAPCGSNAVFAYTTALNYLLNKDSAQRMQIGDASTVFWSAKSNKLERDFPLFFNMSPKDNPDAGSDAVKELLNSVKAGTLNIDETNKTEFYVLGLSPNAARLAVRFFIKDTVFGMSKNIAQHFEDLKIDKPKLENEFLPLFKLLVSTASLGKSENIAPHLAGDFMMSVLKGLPYPATLLQAVINRIKAEKEITYPRAALIKAYLNRLARYKNQKEELTVSLNKDNTNQGYVLGRLFAALEKLQEEAQGTTNSTIMRFYGSASSAPVAVFANLMRLHQHHLSKLSKESAGRAINFEKLISEIQSKIDDKKGYPPHLSLTEQGMFSIGYYQQRQDFFKVKEEKTAKENQLKGE